MGWVVKELRTDLFDAMRLDAERDARRVRRTADRSARRVSTDLAALEELAVELRRTVRRQRSSAVAPAARLPTPAQPAKPAPAAALGPRRAARASMRSSPLNDLLRTTGARPRFPRALLDARS